MSRLELGSRVLIIGTSAKPGCRAYERQKKFIGASGTLTDGPYVQASGSPSYWTVSGPEIAARKRRKHRTYLLGVPSFVLVRIDDPDVTLEPVTEVPIKESVS